MAEAASPRGDPSPGVSGEESVLKRSLRRASTKAGLFRSKSSKGLQPAGSLPQGPSMAVVREVANSQADETVDLGWVAEQVEQVVHHRGMTNIEVGRLQTFNFTTTDSGVIGPHDIDLTTLGPTEYKNYTSSVLRFAPVEVSARLHGRPVPSPTHFFNGYTAVINNEEGRELGVQAYEHGFEAAVLFSDISGFTKLTNRLIAERDKEGAEILNQIINRYFEELIDIIHRHAGDVMKFAGDACAAGGSRTRSSCCHWSAALAPLRPACPPPLILLLPPPPAAFSPSGAPRPAATASTTSRGARSPVPLSR